jgi:hypothetical protein
MPPDSSTATIQPNDVLFSFGPRATFSRTFSTLLATLLLGILIFAFVDFNRNGDTSRLFATAATGTGCVGLLYLLTRLVDKAQASARLEVTSDGTLTFRNAVGRVRRIDLVGARSLQVRNFKGAATRYQPVSGTQTYRRLNRGSIFGPKLTQIRIRDQHGKKLHLVFSGDMPGQQLERFYEVAGAFMKR